MDDNVEVNEDSTANVSDVDGVEIGCVAATGEEEESAVADNETTEDVATEDCLTFDDGAELDGNTGLLEDHSVAEEEKYVVAEDEDDKAEVEDNRIDVDNGDDNCSRDVGLTLDVAVSLLVV